MKPDYSQLLLNELKKYKNESRSGEILSQQLNISRTAIWKHIKKLQTQGYEIKANGKLGYQLSFEPEPIAVEQLKNVKFKMFNINISYRNQVESTQTEAKHFAEKGLEQGTLIIAEQQHHGKGRLGRIWHSPYGKGLWMSFILRPNVSIQFAPQLTLLVAVALCETLRQYLELPATIKWPNDVLINGKKCSGILLESVAEEQRLKYVIAGIGINVNLSQDDFPEELKELATSLRIEADKIIDRTQFLIEFYQRFDKLLYEFEKYGFSAIAIKWEAYADGFGALKKIKQGDHIFYATPFKLDDSGALWVRHKDGKEEKIFAAEIGEVRK